MATARVEFDLEIGAAEAWALVGDYGAPAEIAPGFVASCVLEGDDRTVTFASGLVARERLVSIDDERRRLAYSAVGGRADHHNATMEVIDCGIRQSRICWTTDVLPHELGPAIQSMMEQGAAAIRAYVAEGALPATA